MKTNKEIFRNFIEEAERTIAVKKIAIKEVLPVTSEVLSEYHDFEKNPVSIVKNAWCKWEIMNVFYPKKFPQLDVYFNMSGGQKQTKNDPGIQPFVEFKEININNTVRLPEDLESYLVETFGEQWEKEILNEFWY